MADAEDQGSQRGGASGSRGDPRRGEPVPGIEAGRVLGDFRLLRRLGRGGMGQVWEAEQISLRRRVALKLLRTGEALSAIDAPRLQREAQAGGRLQHRAIVAIYAYGEVAGIPFIAQELVAEGRSLGDLIEDARRDGDLPEDWYPRMAAFFAEAAEALQAAHDAGVIHRDLKPGNILLASDGQPKIADFGLARVTDAESFQRSGDLAGTWRYMSPEQVMAKRMGLDARTDVFSLGATLYEALTLRHAFDGDTSQQIAERILYDEPPAPHLARSRVPRDLSIICGKALEKRREHRYATMADLAADLRRHLANEPIHARPAGPVQRALKWTRRHPTLAAVLALGGVALASLAVVAAVLLENAALQQRERATVDRRWAATRLAELESDAAALSLIGVDVVERCDAWLLRARDLTARLDPDPAGGAPGFRAELERLRATALAAPDAGSRTWRFASEDAAVIHEDLSRLVAGIEALTDPETGWVAGTEREDGWSVLRLRDQAAPLAERTTTSPEARRRWTEAVASIASREQCPAYDGLVLAPHVGLLPIGRDPVSGLWEFWHLLSGAEPQRDAAGRLLITGGTGVVLVLIPAGRFQMGTSEDHPEGHPEGYNSDEVPQHEVRLEAFLLGKTECTQGQWQAVMESNPSSFEEAGLSAPVESVSWLDVQSFEHKTGLVLPSEAQWEYACRAGTTGDHHGSVDEIAWYDENSEGTTHPVAQKQANAFGLHDMSGNVWEWCEDTWHDDYTGAPVDGSPWVDSSGPGRVVRGGSWGNGPRFCRSAYRDWRRPTNRFRFQGFRVCLLPGPVASSR